MHLKEMYGLLQNIVKLRSSLVLPIIHKKAGVGIVDFGKDLGEIKTNLDIGFSAALLSGVPGLGIEGVLEKYPGSFSEESEGKYGVTNAESRLLESIIYQIDPIDGTGDFSLSYRSVNVIGPTTLVSKLQKYGDKFKPVAAMIFDIVRGIALMSDGKDIEMYSVTPKDKLRKVIIEIDEPEKHDLIRINRRIAYPQLDYDGWVKNDLSQMQKVEVTHIGGAGLPQCSYSGTTLESILKVLERHFMI